MYSDAIFYTSCNKDDEHREEDPCGFLYGTWKWETDYAIYELTFLKDGKGTWNNHLSILLE